MEHPKKNEKDLNLLSAVVTVVMFFSFLGFAINLRKTTFFCHKIEDRSNICHLELSGIMGSETTLIPLEDLRRSTVEKHSDSEGTTYKFILITKDRRFRLDRDLLNQHGRVKQKREKANKINDFLAKETERFVLVEENISWITYVFTYSMCLLTGWMSWAILLDFKKKLNRTSKV